MLDWLKNQPLWRWFSELDTLFSLVTCVKVVVAVITGLVAAFWGWLEGQPGSVQFVLFLSACLISLGFLSLLVWLRQRLASNYDKSIAAHAPPIELKPNRYICDAMEHIVVRFGTSEPDSRKTYTNAKKLLIRQARAGKIHVWGRGISSGVPEDDIREIQAEEWQHRDLLLSA